MTRPATVLLLVLLLALPPASGDWAMFGGDATHSGLAALTERSIDKRAPVVSWDRGNGDPGTDCSGVAECETVFSWGSVIGNFSAGVDGEYDRNVLHIAWATAEEDGDDLRGFLEIRDGGFPGRLMWRRDLGIVRDSSNASLETEFSSYDAAYATPTLGDFNGNGRPDIAIATPHGVVEFFEPKITWNSGSGTYGSSGAVWSNGHWSYDTGLTIVRSNPAVADLDGGDDLVISGLTDEGTAVVIALDGNGTRLWRYEFDATEVSSPVVLREGASRKVFVSFHDNGNLKVYGIQGGNAISGWGPKTVGSIVDPDDINLHPLLPSLLLADFTDDDGTEIIVPRPAPVDGGDASLHVYQLDGTAAADWGSSYTFSDGGDRDATPAIGDIDGDGDLELVAVTWLDPMTPTSPAVLDDKGELVAGIADISRSDLIEHDGGDVVEVGDIQIRLIHTPGHTPGSQCFLVEQADQPGQLVSGDTLFLGSCGRVDLPGSDPEAMYHSLNDTLKKLPDETLLFPGHLYSPEPSAPMGETRRSNFVFTPRTEDQWLGLFGR